MKNIIKRYSLFIVIMVFSSCSDLFDINNDPDNPGTASTQLILPSGISSSAYAIGGWYQILGGFWAQHWTQSTGASQHRNIDDYNVLSTDFDYQWDELFAGALSDMEYLRKTSLETENWSYYLMATTIQSYSFQVLVDLYDNIPFSEALKGNEGIFAPKYETGQVIYDSLLNRLDFALSQDFTFYSNANPNATAIEPGKDDLLFYDAENEEENFDEWVAFANTLKLKLLLRQVYARPDFAKQNVIDMANEGAEFLTVDAAMTQFTGEQDRRNPVYETGVDRLSGNITASATTVNIMDVNSDPRVDILFNKPTGSAVHVALAQGDYRASSPVNISGLSTPDLSGTDPVYFMTAAESYFLQAEAALRWPELGWNARTLYEAGIEAAFQRLGLTNASDYYGAGDVYEYASTGDIEADLEQIILQKWLSMINIQGLEAFEESNRTHYPAIFTPSVNNVTGDVFPKRLLYPNDEYAQNPANVPSQVTVTTKVWWDKK